MDNKIAEHTISAIFVQIKLRHDKASPQKTRDMDEAKLRFFPPKGVHRSNERVDQRPYITLFLDLGVGVRTYLPPRLVVKKKDEGAASIKGTTTTNVDPAVVAIQRPARKSSRLQPELLPHLRYAFHVRGCNSDVYKVIASKDNDSYQSLLQNRDMFHEAPRPNLADAVNEFKSEWRCGPSSWAWVKDDYLNNKVDSSGNEELDGDEDELDSKCDEK